MKNINFAKIAMVTVGLAIALVTIYAAFNCSENYY